MKRLRPRDMAELCLDFAQAHGWVPSAAGWMTAPGEPRDCYGQRMHSIRTSFGADESLDCIAAVLLPWDGSSPDREGARASVLAWAEAHGLRPFRDRSEAMTYTRPIPLAEAARRLPMPDKQAEALLVERGLGCTLLDPPALWVTWGEVLDALSDGRLA